MQELFVKCPSCGAVLQVKNPKNEAVKRISCPNCKKLLTVNFENTDQHPSSAAPKPLGTLYYGEMPIPLHEGVSKTAFPGSSHVEVMMARMPDGSGKCIVRALDANAVVKVNGEQLQLGDKLVLAVGDFLQIDHQVLCFGKPCVYQERKRDGQHQVTAPNTIPTSSRSRSWLPYAVVVLVLGGAAIFFWPEKKNEAAPPATTDMTGVWPVIEKSPHQEKKATTKTQEASDDQRKNTPAVTKKEYNQLNDYDLGILSKQGDIDAQYELGRRYVQKGDVNNTVLGLNYLRLASLNGSTKASEAYQKCMNRLQQKVASGDSIAQVILRSVEK